MKKLKDASGWMLIVFLVCFASSCRTSKTVATSKHVEVITKDSTRSVVDTSKSQVTTIAQTNTIYNDTLTGNLNFTDEQINEMENPAPVSDSIESGGVKVKVTIEKTKNGIKTKITAVAKPRQITDSHTTITNDQKGISETTSVTDIKVVADERKDIKIKGFPWKLVGWLSLPLLLFAIIAYIFYKKF